MAKPHLLLTGATGFIGGASLAHLLATRPDAGVLLLVRGDTPHAARERVRRSLERFLPADEVAAHVPRCDVLAGDLTDAACLADARLDAVTHVLHAAANTSFRSVRGVRHANLLGTLTLAHRLRRAPKLERFLHVSTAYLCGDDPPRVVHEGDYPRPMLRHVVEYTGSKAEAELLLANTAPELPLIVARPSVVVGHTRLGCLPSASIFWFYKAVDLLRRTAWPLDALDDVIPVDYAAEALAFLLFKPELRHRCYHVSAGEVSAVSWHEIAAAFTRVHGERPDDPYREVDFATIRAERDRLLPRLGPGDEEHLLTALEIYYRFGSLAVELFDNARLLAEGMPPPPRFTTYLERCATMPPGRGVYEQMRDDE